MLPTTNDFLAVPNVFFHHFQKGNLALDLEQPGSIEVLNLDDL